MIISRPAMTPQERSDFDNTIASSERNAALIDYLAMMLDVEIPTEEDEENE